jgi:hypothetical protein
LLPPSSIERRRLHPSVAELRRQLREADRQRFELEAALSGAAHRWLDAQDADVPRPAGARWTRAWHRPAAALLTVCVCGALVERATRHESPPAASNRVTVETRLVDARMVQQNPPESASIPLPPAVVLAARPAPRLRGEPRIGARARPIRRRAPEQMPRSVPRPLSPGEFGRVPVRRAGW